MLRSMYSAVSGLRVHQTMLDVTGNNISNVNTFGFKTGRAVFEDNLSQIIRGSSAPVPATGGGPGIGGINPVSYTHLDVYKRQTPSWSHCLRQKFPVRGSYRYTWV